MSENQNDNHNNDDFGKIIPINWKERLDPADLPKRTEPVRQTPRRRPEDTPEPAAEPEPEQDPEEELEQSLRKRVREKVKQQKREKRRKKMIRFACVLGVLIVGVLIFQIVYKLESVEVEGNEYYTDAQLTERLVTGRTDQNTLLLYLKIRRMKENPLPFIEKLDVEMEDTHTLRVSAYEKAVIGCIHYMSQYINFDKDGIVVETGESPKNGVPVITGLQMKSFALFQTMEIEDESLYTTVLGLSQLIQKYELEIDRIEFDLSQNVTLYSEEIEIRLGRRDMYDDQLAELKNLLPAAKGLSGILDMKDFKPGQSRIILQEKEH